MTMAHVKKIYDYLYELKENDKHDCDIEIS